MSLFHDLRFALRIIAKERWFTAVAVAALALGIGVNATVFTLVNAVLIKGLPFKDSAQLYMLGPKRPADGGMSGLSMQELQDYRAQSQTFAGLAGFSGGNFNLADERGFPEQANGSNLTANAFRVLGQAPLLGRDFVDGEDKRGAERVVILGYTLWKNRYGADQGVIGRPIRVNGEPATIVGVMPDNMRFPTNAAMWMAFQPAADEQRSNRPLQIFGRLRADSSFGQAQAEIQRIAAGHATKYPDTNKELTTALVQTFNQRFNGGPIRQIFLAMMGAVGFVLLIACANVANLLLSRSTNRAREIAVRLAMGATRWRVVRQLLVESVVLGAIGGGLGLLLSLGGVRAFDAAVADVGKPYWIQFTTDWTVIGYLAAICVLTGVLFGLAPALQVSRTSVSDVLKEGGRGNSGSRRARWMSGTMVVVEIALTIILLTGAGVMTRAFLALYRDDIGIKTDYLMTMRLVLPGTKYPKPEVRQEFFDRLAPRLAGVAGAESVALATNIPPQGGGRRLLEIEGGKQTAGADWPEVTTVTAGPNYFETLGAPIRAGRGFNDTDGKPGFETVVINQRFAQLMFPGEDPMGRRIRFPARQPNAPPPTGPAAANQTPPVWRHDRRHRADIAPWFTAGRAATGRRLHPDASGKPRVRDAAHPQQDRPHDDDELGAARSAGHRSGPARLHRSDHGAAARAAAVAVRGLRHVVRDLRRDRAGARRRGALRRDGVLGHAAYAGDWRSNGARRRHAPGVVADSAPRPHSTRHRADHRIDRGLVCDRSAADADRRQQSERPANVLVRHRRAGRRRARCLPDPGAPRDPARPAGGVAERITNRGASPLGLPYTLSRAPLRRRASASARSASARPRRSLGEGGPFAWLSRCRSLAPFSRSLQVNRGRKPRTEQIEARVGDSRGSRDRQLRHRIVDRLFHYRGLRLVERGDDDERAGERRQRQRHATRRRFG